MRRFWILTTTLIGMIATVSPAQPPSPEDKSTITFDTVDHVRMTGTFYRGGKGIDSPTVMMIHRFKSDRTAKGWDSLAAHLQSKLGCSVLTFDFRGHGASKSVQSKFWSFEQNKNGIRGGQSARPKSEISFNEFKGTYWPVLLNDLAAARYYIDQQNDAQLCNASTIIVIAAEDAAGLAMGWVSYEFDRRVVPSGTSMLSLTPTGRVPGEDIAAGIWLGPTTRGGSVSFRPTEWFGKNSKLRESTPMYFIYGKDDQYAMSVPGMLAAVKKPPEGSRNKHSLDREEKLNTKLPGQDLIGNTSLEVNVKVEKYVDEIIKHHRTPWRSMNSAPPSLFPLAVLGFQQPN